MSLIFKECDKVRIYDKCMNRALIAMPALIRLLYGTGMRISEALSLYNKDVDISNGVITLHKTKNRKERLVPLSDSLVSVLSQYVEYRDRIPVKRIAAQNQKFFVKANGLGFSKDTAYYFSEKSLTDAEYRILEEVEVPEFTISDTPMLSTQWFKCANKARIFIRLCPLWPHTLDISRHHQLNFTCG